MASKTSRKMIAALQVSLDGFTQGPDRGEADWVDSWADAIQLILEVDMFVQGAGMYPGYGEYWESIYANPERVPPYMTRLPSNREIAYAQLAAKTPTSLCPRPQQRLVDELRSLNLVQADSTESGRVILTYRT